MIVLQDGCETCFDERLRAGSTKRQEAELKMLRFDLE